MALDSRKILLLSAVIAPILIIHYASPPAGGIWLATLYDSLHVPLFGVIGLSVFWTTPPNWTIRARLLVTIIAVISFGVLSELAQVPTERDASLRDFASNVLGGMGFIGIAAAASSKFSFRRTKRRYAAVFGGLMLLWPLLPLMTVSAAYIERFQMLPSLVRFDSRFGEVLYSVQDAELSIRKQKSDDEVTAEIIFKEGSWPGIEFHDLWPDWEPYSDLVIEIENPGTEVLPVNIRVDDWNHRRTHRFDDRFNKKSELSPGRQAIRIKLTDIQNAPLNRQIDLQKIDGLWIFAPNDEVNSRLILHDVRLERRE